MTSILTNNAAMSALSTLRSISDDLDGTQEHISSGYRVANASDNAAYWSIATTMRSDNRALGTIQDALGLAASKVDTAYAGMSSVIDIVSSIKAKLVAAREPGVDKDKVNKEITELKNQIQSVAQSASFSGENWLYNASTNAVGTKEMVGSFVRDASGNAAIVTVDFDTSKSVLIDTKTATRGLLTTGNTVTQPSGATTTTATYYMFSATGSTGSQIQITSATSNDNLEGMIVAVDKLVQTLTDGAAALGAINSRVSNQSAFGKNLIDAIDKGVGRLVDADMNEESTRLKAAYFGITGQQFH
nr:flagellin [uncultured Gellertiella sp.]